MFLLALATALAVLAPSKATIAQFNLTEDALSYWLYGAMIAYEASNEKIVMIGGESGQSDDVNDKFIEFDITDVELAKHSQATTVNGSTANQVDNVMLEHKSVAIGDAIYYLKVGGSQDITWHIYNVTARTEIAQETSIAWATVKGVTLCSDGGSAIFVNILGVKESGEHYSRCLEYNTMDETWSNVTEEISLSSFAFYGSCVWSASTNKILMFGGLDYVTSQPLSDIWSVDRSTGEAVLQAQLQIPRFGTGVFAMPDANEEEHILIIGGCLQADELYRCAINVINSEVYNLTTLSVAGFGPRLYVPLAQSASIFKKNILWMFGGISNNDGRSSDLQYLDMSTVTWTQLITNVTNVEKFLVFNSIDAYYNSSFSFIYQTTSFEDAVEKAIWTSVNATSLVYFATDWNMSNAQYIWYTNRNTSVTVGCDRPSQCRVFAQNSILVHLYVGQLNINVAVQVQDLNVSVAKSDTDPRIGQLITLDLSMFNNTYNPGLVQLGLSRILLTFAKRSETHGVWINSPLSQNGRLTIDQVHTINNGISFVHLIGGSDFYTYGWAVELTNTSLQSSLTFVSGSPILSCDQSTFCFRNIQLLYASNVVWNGSSSVEKALDVQYFDTMHISDIEMSGRFTAHYSPIAAAYGGQVYAYGLTCTTIRGNVSACIWTEQVNYVTVDTVYCEGTSGGESACVGSRYNYGVTISNVGCYQTSASLFSGCVYTYTYTITSIDVQHITCTDTTGKVAGCVYVLSFYSAILNDISIDNAIDSQMSIFAAGGQTLTSQSITCDTVYNFESSCFYANGISYVSSDSVTCKNSFALATACVEALFISSLNLQNILCQNVSSGFAACLVMENSGVLTVDGFTCADTYAIGGCMIVTWTNTADLTHVNSTNTLGVSVGALFLYVVNSVMISSSILNSNFMSDSAINYGAGVHLEVGAAIITNSIFSGNHGFVIYTYMFICYFFVALFLMSCNMFTQYEIIRPFGGGALSSSASALTIQNSLFYRNSGDKLGGATFHNYGDVVFTNCTFQENHADQGGAIGFYAPAFRLFLSNCTFQQNFASAQGGAIFIDKGNYNIENTLAQDNIAKSNGGFLFDGDGYFICAAKPNYISRTVITTNSAQQGGGLYIHGCRFEMNDSRIVNNSASQTGAGIMIDVSSGFHYLLNVTLSENIAGSSGGGLTITGGNILLEQCTFANNDAATTGGGIFLTHAPLWGMNVTLLNSTLDNNSADNGGAIALTSSASSNFFEWSASPLLMLSSNSLSKNQANMNGGAVYVQMGSIELNSNNFDSNNANMEGGGIHVLQGWIQDSASTFSQNSAKSGGGMGCDVPLIQLLNSTFVKNNADNGGGLWLQSCPSFDFFYVQFQENKAQYSGGAIYIDEQGKCPVCGSNSSNCQYQNNGAAFGSDTGTGPQKLKLTYGTDLSKGLNQKQKVKIQGILLDAYGQIVTQLEQTTVLSVSISGADVKLTGRYEDTFSKGTASLEFFITPGDSIRHNNKKLDLTLDIYTQPYSFNQSVTARYSNHVYTPQLWTIAINSAVGIVGIFSVITTALLMWWYRESPIIRGATPPFLVIILFGCLLLSVSIILLPFMPQDAPCQLMVWLLHFSFIFIMAPITGKTWRIYMIFYTAKKKFQRFNFTTTRLFLLFLVLPSLVILGYLLAWTFVQSNWTEWQVESDGTNKEYCSLNNIFLTISLACGVILLLWLVRLAVGVRDVPKNFNESFWLGAAIYTLALIMLFMVPISVINSVPPEAKQVLGGIASWIALEAVLGFIFWRKYYMIWFHGEEVKTKGKDQNSEDSNMSSTDSSNMAGSDLSTNNASRSGKSGTKTGHTLNRADSTM
ncbi:hypothetical protein RFI_22811 [Reticulomyxa filosa]|uniref:G-protein coupled receptors family 3 profile domain-containing protein n=1 Tax=Reticulomyxa filosa TaxID=46433 RepID=X6MN80_RETFI|nr:hypothetical protein RFI_22811 [Reticulomyxa filosa]|eukprot:ETO14560.1 hypothetical protein RFI_22811 [Reticulomyxa filosa]